MKNTIIKFKTKPGWATVASEDLAGWATISHAIKMPRKLTKRHITHVGSKHESFSNSDMLPAIVSRDLPRWAKLYDRGFDVNHPPQGVTVEGDFMKTVTIVLEQAK